MNFFSHFRDIVRSELEYLGEAGRIPEGLDDSRITVEPPRQAAHGDLSTNAAMVLAKQTGMPPHDLARLLVERLERQENVSAAHVAGPGFVNLQLTDAFWHERLADALRAGAAYGDSDVGAGEPVNVEYVSNNPTGPLHVGHARGAVVGDAIANLLEKAGYRVLREYYVNDAGAQVDNLAYAAYQRYLEALGEPADEDAFKARFPDREWEYQGDYLKPIGEALAREFGTQFKNAAPNEWLAIIRSKSVQAMLDLIKSDLATLNIRHDVFTSERELVEAGRVEAALGTLDSQGLIYTGVLDPPKGKVPDDWEPRPQTLFRSTQFGDDVDRPLKKSDGSWTYFASDIAYHLDKSRRGFATMIDVWGADHGGHVKRMKAAVTAITGGQGTLDIKLCQMVKLLERGEPVKMSKRAGTYVSLREVTDRVGRDVLRFMMLTRKNDAALDFDLAKATEQSLDNPVFYVQYAHARACSAMRNAREAFPALDTSDKALASADLARLTDPAELALIKLVSEWPRQVEMAAETREPHRLAFYLFDLVAAFHSLWSKGNKDPGLRFIIQGESSLTAARLAMVRGMALVIASGLQIFGVKPVEELR